MVEGKKYCVMRIWEYCCCSYDYYCEYVILNECCEAAPAKEEKKEEEVPVPADVVIPGSETPAAIQLRKEAGDETPYEPKSLYTHLEEVEVSGGEGFMPPTKKYVIPSSK